MRTSFFFILLTAVFLVCCTELSKKQEHSQNEEIGKYVYIDYANVLHTRQGCKAVFTEHSMQMVTPVKIERLNSQQLARICSQCVTEKQLDSLYKQVGYTND